ncbi:MAG TPA: hypothetical protein PLO65_16300 [Caulobacter sp.]|nr:hypothetical protein [Caulobacter sp.]
MNRRKTLLYSLAVGVGIAGVAISQWVMTHLKPSTELAVAYPAMLLGTGLIAGVLAYFADPGDPDRPTPSNDTDAKPEKVRVRVRRPGRRGEDRA